MPRLVSDLLRVLATLAVIAIHATDAWRLSPGRPTDAGQWSAVVLDQLCRFCVPLFVLLSGYALGKRHGDDPRFTTRDFLLRRASRIGAPYLLWSALNLAVLSAIGVWHWQKPLASAVGDCFHGQASEPVWWSAVRWLASGGADYHLYFLPIIVQCYLLFPLLRRWRADVVSVIGVSTLLLLWTAYQEGTRVAGWPWPGLWSTFPLPWLLIFLLGMWIAAHDVRLAEWLRRLPAPIAWALVLSGPAWCIADFCWTTSHGVISESAGDFARPATPWYALSLTFAALRWGPLWERLCARAAPLIGVLAVASFATYLSHTWVLRGLEASGLKGLGRVIWVPLAITASLLVGHVLTRLAAKWRPLGWLIGA